MVVSEAAKLLKNSLENTHICGSINDPSLQFKSELNNLVSLRCTRICKEGGGKSTCEIRKCCKNNNLNGCWECNGFENCTKLKEQFINNNKKIRALGINGFIKEVTK